MQNFSSFLLTLILATCTVTARQGARLPGHEAGSQKEQQQIACSASMEHTLVVRGSPVNVHIRIENNSPEDVLATSMTANLRAKQRSNSREFYLPMRTYSSGIDIETGSALEMVNDAKLGWSYPKRKLVLAAKRNVELAVDLAALEWSEESAPALPWARLYGVLPNGVYELDFVVGVSNRTGVSAVSCRKTSLQIQGSSKQSPSR